MYWVFHILGRGVRGCTNPTCVQCRINYTCVSFVWVLCVWMSPLGSSVAVLRTLEASRIPFYNDCPKTDILHQSIL